MAIIYSYPRITPTPSDLLLVSDNSVQGNPTKTVSINDVLALVPSGGGGGGVSSITSNNTNFLSVTNPTGPFVTLNLQVGTVQQGGNTLATTGDIYSFTTTSITNAINALGPVGSVNSFSCSIASIPAFTATVINPTTNPSLTIGRTGGSAGQFLDYTGNWSTPSVVGMTRWKLTADTGGVDSIEQDEIVDIEGDSVKISTQLRNLNPGEYTISVSHNTQGQTNTTPGPTPITNGGTFTALSQNVDVDGTGHVTGQTLRTYQLPTVGGVNTVSAISPVFLDPSGTASDPVIAVDLSSKQDAIQAVTGNGTSGVATLAVDPNTNLLTLNVPQYAGGGGGGVTSVGLNMTSNIPAFSVSNSPITTAGDLVVGIAGGPATTEYLDGSGNWSTPAGTGTNLNNTPGTSSVEIFSSTGSPTIIGAATQSIAGVMTAALKTKLDGIAAGAEVNVQSNWTETDSANDSFIQNKPTIPTQFSWTLDGDTGTPQVIADASTVNIVGTGSVSTDINGNTLTISSTASGSGTVTDIDVTNGSFTIGSVSTSPNPIQTSGTISFDLSALGNANTASFLRGDNKWSTLTNGGGVAALTNSTTGPTYETTIALEYTGNRNVIEAAQSPLPRDLELTDTIIINDKKSGNDEVYKVELQDLQDIVSPVSNIPTYFATELDSGGNAVFANEGNISNNTQGLGGTVASWSLTKAADNTLEVRFGTQIGSGTYMVNFSIEELYPNPGSKPNYALATIQNKDKNGFDVQYNPIGDFAYDSSNLSEPVLTNFIIFV